MVRSRHSGRAVAALFVIAFAVDGRSLVRAQDLPHFLRLPFEKNDIAIQQGWIYQDGTIHLPHGAIDYINGTLDDSTTWQTFDVVAAADGIAIWDDDPSSDPSRYGNMVLIRHDQTDAQGRHYFTLYAHLQDGTVSARIPKLGRRNKTYPQWVPIKAGDYLGKAGSTGWHKCTADCIHLHFEVNVDAYYQGPTDPYTVYGQRALYPGACISFLWLACPPFASPVNHQPTGSLDDINSFNQVFGWGKDPDDENAAITVHLYVDKNAGTPGAVAIPVVADQLRSDVGNHAFSWDIPSALRDGQTHTVWAWGIDLSDPTNNNARLPGSPKTFNVTPGPPSTTLIYDEDQPLLAFGQPVIDSIGALYLARTQYGFGCGFGVCEHFLQKIVPGNPSAGWITPALSSDALATLGIAIGPGNRVYFQGARSTLWAFEADGTSSPGLWPATFSDRFARNTLIDNPSGEVFVETASFGACFDSCSHFFGAFNSTGERMWNFTSTTTAAAFQQTMMFLSFGRNIYSLTSSNFVHYERETGVPFCTLPLSNQLFHSAVGNASGIFSSFRSTLTSYDPDCSLRDIFVDDPGRTDLFVLDARLGTVLATDGPTSTTFNPLDLPLIGVKTDGSGSWRNSTIALESYASGNPIRAAYGSTVYVLGFDLSDSNSHKLFGVNVLFGNIVSEVNLTGVCDSCGVAVDNNGNLYINDLGSTRIYKVQ